MRSSDQNIFSPLCIELFGRGDNRSPSVDYVIDNNAGFAFDITDDIDDFCLIGRGAALIDNRKLRTGKRGCQIASAMSTAMIGGDNDDFARVDFYLL